MNGRSKKKTTGFRKESRLFENEIRQCGAWEA